MSDNPIGTCCAIAFVACLDVCTGICVDYASFRHGCTETMCRCRCCERSEKELDWEDGEHAPLLHQNQPAASEPMVPDPR
ncbi:hypothetical protein V8E52_006987 [Russula decolorans]